MPTKRTLVVLGHPDADSYCGALASAYIKGLERAGAEYRVLDINTLDFDPVLHKGYKVIQKLEPDLVAAQEAIRWAQHLCFVYPLWWGSMPAVLKGFIDRTFVPGFGFSFHGEKSYLWDPLLTGRSARLIITMDGPPLAIRMLYSDPAVKQMKGMTLEFCGIRPVRVMQCGSVKRATRARRLLWKMNAEDLGFRQR